MDRLISVIMPAYNAEKYIRQAIDSVLCQQGDFAIELLVIDDGSTDQTVSIVKSYLDQTKKDQGRLQSVRGLRLLQNADNMGVAGARNRGIKEAKGEYLAFLDADDWWEPQKLEKQLSLMEEKNAVLCATGRELRNADGSRTEKYIGIPEIINYKMLLRTNSIPCSSVLMRTSVAREFYMCHDELHEDYILWLSVIKKYKVVYGLNEPLLKCRLSEGGKSRNKLKSARMQYGVYRYLGFGVIRSLFYLMQYAVNGVKKYA